MFAVTFQVFCERASTMYTWQHMRIAVMQTGAKQSDWFAARSRSAPSDVFAHSASFFARCRSSAYHSGSVQYLEMSPVFYIDDDQL
jgi:hypothetical protein